MATIHTDGRLQPFCVRCRGCQTWPHLNVWKAPSASADAYDKEAEDGRPDDGQCGGRVGEEKKGIDVPLVTPTTKADVGHEENMTPSDLVEPLGKETAERAKQSTLALF